MKPHKKKGRPFKNDKPLNIDLKIRIDEETNNQIINYAAKNDITKVEVVRRSIKSFLNDKPK